MEMRGLHAFITDLRKAAAQSKEAEQQRIDKELHHIRQKFKEPKGLKGYDKKKYVCKLLYVFMLGYEVDFGHMQGIELLSGTKYSEKHIGYLAITLFLNERHELMTMVTQSVKKDLTGGKEFIQCLALTAIANVGGKDFADAMMNDVAEIACSRETRSMVKKKALLTLLRLYRRAPERLEPETYSNQIIEELGREDLGVVNAALSLILGLISKYPEHLFNAVPKCIRLLHKVQVQKETVQEYIYYQVPAPWVQVKAFRVLQNYAMPTGSLRNQINTVLSKIITSSERTLKDQQASKARATPARSNASNAVLTEAINTVIHWDCDRELLNHSANILGKYITDTKDTNLRYIGLELMSRLSFCGEVFSEHIKKYQVAIVNSLKDPDISIRRKALDLLYVMCDKSNADEIVGELIHHLPVSEHQIREDLVIKIAILAEKFAASFSWYVDMSMKVIQLAGNYVSPDVWQRVVQIVTNNEDIQKQAARICMSTLATLSAHETCVKVGSHILGEFGWLIQDEPRFSSIDQFNALHSKYALVGNDTRALLLNAYAKMCTSNFQFVAAKDLQPNMVVSLTPSAMADRCNPQGPRDQDPRFIATVLSRLQGDAVRLRWHSVEEGGPPPGLTLAPQESKAWLDGEKSEIFARPMVIDPRDGLDIRGKARAVFEENVHHMDPEIQQRASEYRQLTDPALVPEQTLEVVLEGMPPFSMTNTARVFENVINKGTDTTDSNVWQQKREERERQSLAEMRADQEQREAEEAQDWRPLLVPIQTMIQQAAAARGIDGTQEDVVREWAASQGALCNPSNPWPGDKVLYGMVLDQMQHILSQLEMHAPGEAIAEITAYAEGIRRDADIYFPNRGDDKGAVPPPASEPPAPAPAEAPAPAPAPAPPQPEPTPPAPPARSVLDDIFGDAPAAAPAPAAPVPGLGGGAGNAGTIDCSATVERFVQSFPHLLGTVQGLLFEDERLQVGFKAEYHGADGRLALFCTNKSDSPIGGLSIEMHSPFPALSINTQPAAPDLNPQQQVQIFMQCKCTGPFSYAPGQGPTGRIQYQLKGQSAAFALPLPVSIGRFVEPMPLQNAAQFVQVWQQTQGTTQPPTFKIYPWEAVDLDKSQALLEGMRLKVLRAVDNNTNNMIGAGWFTAVTPNVAVLVNWETNPEHKAVRVTVKTPLAELEEEFQSCLGRKLGTPAR